MEAPRDHQVKDQEQLAVELDRDALAEPVQVDDRPPLRRRRRRVDRAEEERAREPQAAEQPAGDPLPQALDVDDDVGQLGHARPIVPCRARLSGRR